MFGTTYHREDSFPSRHSEGGIRAILGTMFSNKGPLSTQRDEGPNVRSPPPGPGAALPIIDGHIDDPVAKSSKLRTATLSSAMLVAEFNYLLGVMLGGGNARSFWAFADSAKTFTVLRNVNTAFESQLTDGATTPLPRSPRSSSASRPSSAPALEICPYNCAAP